MVSILPEGREREDIFPYALLTYLFKSKALSSQLEAILDDEQKQLNLDNSNDAGGGAGTGATNSWNSDESYEDYYNEGTCAWYFVLHVTVVVRFLCPCVVVST